MIAKNRTNRPLMDQVREAAYATVAVGLAAVFAGIASADPPARTPFDQYRLRSSITLAVRYRDFQPAAAAGGHPDFFKAASAGAGRYAGIAAVELPADNAPALESTGFKVVRDWTDSASSSIISPRAYITPAAGDVAGSTSSSPGGAVSSASSFAQWFRDAAGVNAARNGTLTLTRDGGGVYSFDSTLDGFKGSGITDYNYTASISDVFVHEAGRRQYIAVATSGDAWLYIDGKLMIDLGSGGGNGSSGLGIVVGGNINLTSGAEITAASGSVATVTTTAVGSGVVSLGSSTKITGDVYIGVGGNPTTNITLASNAQLTGGRSALNAPIAMPALPAIPNIGPSVGDVSYKKDTTLSADVHANNLSVDSSRTLTISGHRTIVCDGTFSLTSSTALVLAPGATLALYCAGFDTAASSDFNKNTANPALVTIYVYGRGPVKTSSTSGVYANLLAPDAPMVMSSNAAFTGNAFAQSLDMGSNSKFIVADTGNWGGLGPAVPGMSAKQRIDLDRLGWLTDGQTHTIHFFFANRTGRPSLLRLEHNLQLLKVATPPTYPDYD